MANWVSLLRVVFGFGVAWLLFQPGAFAYWFAFLLTILVIWMDGLDGYLARKLGEASKAGAVIDILGDRIVEMTYWITFMALNWVPLWMPLLVMTRGILVDGLRSLAFEHGHTAFGSTTMMKSKLGVFLVSSRASRWLYAAFKAVAFSLLILAYTPNIPVLLSSIITIVAYISIFGTLLFCVLRGLPVLLEAKRYLR